MSGAAGLAELESRIGHASITTTVGVYGRLITDVRPYALDPFAADAQRLTQSAQRRREDE